MKQIIVLISSVVLGIAIAGMVLDFETDAQSIANVASQSIEEMVSEF